MKPFKTTFDHPERPSRFVLDTSRGRTTIYDFDTRSVVFDEQGTGKVNRAMAEEAVKKILVAEKRIEQMRSDGGIVHG